MAVTSKMYGNSMLHAMKGSYDYTTSTVKIALLSSGYTPNQDTDEYFSNVSTNEVTGTGYTAGGQALANKSITYDGATNTVKLYADDVTWASSTVTARYGVVYVDTGVASTSVLLGYVDFGQDESSSDGNFTISWDSNGIFNIIVA